LSTCGTLPDLPFQDAPTLPLSVPGPSNSLPSNESRSDFQPYVSPLSQYPSLFSIASTSPSHPSPSTPSSSSAIINRVEQLDYWLWRQLHFSSLSDSNLHCCRFEFPGDGTCSDPDCTDLHRRDLEPSDEEVAEFAVTSFPEFTSEQLKNALTLTSSWPSDVFSSKDSAADPLQRRLMAAVRLLLVHKSIS